MLFPIMVDTITLFDILKKISTLTKYEIGQPEGHYLQWIPFYNNLM